MNTLVSVEEVSRMFNEGLETLNLESLHKDVDEKKTFNKVKSVLDSACIPLKELNEFYKYDPDELRNHRTDFQQKTNKVALKSYLGTRLRTWPQGYQGDYKTLEAIYRNTPLSTGIGYYLDLYILNNPLAEGVRNRLKILENIVAKELQWRQKPHILNIACGSCRELMGLSPDIHKSKAKVVCIDDDSDALNFAMNRLSHTEAAKNISFRKYNAIRMFDHETNLREFGMQDIIYSVGLFDYLPDDFLSTLLKSLYMLLKKNGTFIIAFKDATYYDCTPHHWMADWDGFKQRKERDFTRILNNAQIPLKNLRIQKDATNIISFYLITRVD